jgi:hypothetical protein
LRQGPGGITICGHFVNCIGGGNFGSSGGKQILKNKEVKILKRKKFNYLVRKSAIPCCGGVSH